MNVKTKFFGNKWEGETSSWEIFAAQGNDQVTAINQSKHICLLGPDPMLQRLKAPKKFVVCPSDQFSCRTEDDQCISFDWLCDGGQDCSNNLDEMYCTTTLQNCANKFTCGRQCLPYHRICDGYVDCEHGEDEQNCGTISLMSKETKVK
jgi:Low-density lipoprotein receptor domain class A